jgi:hypothetical protein
MTGPMPQLPNIQLGNTASDIGSGANTFVQGLIGQRQRQAQLAMQQAIAAGRTQLEGAQTQDVQQQMQQRQHENEPSGPDQILQLKHFWPEAPAGIMTGMSREEADALIQHAGMLSMMSSRLGNTEESQLRQAYFRDQVNARKGLDSYRNTLSQYVQAKQSNPYQAEGMLLSWLRQNTNRMNQAEISRISRLGGWENMATRLQSYAQAKAPIDAEMLSALRDASISVGRAHLRDYENFRELYTHRAMAKGLDPMQILDEDYSTDIPGLEAQSGIAPGSGLAPGAGLHPMTQTPGKPYDDLLGH